MECSGLEDDSTTIKHPVILHKSAPMTQLFVRQLHWDHHQAGPSVLLALLTENFFVSSAKKVVRRECVVRRKVYARTLQQQMGRLPPGQVNPSLLFHISGVDLAGPFLCHRGNPRKPMRIKTYACLFICLATCAIHIETLSDLSTSSFVAGFRRFEVPQLSCTLIMVQILWVLDGNERGL